MPVPDPLPPRNTLPPAVSPEWLAEHYDEVLVADVRWYLNGRSGYGAYLSRRLPRAIFVDLDRHLASAPGPAVGRHPLPSPEAFAASMTGLGIGEGSKVIGYDDDGGRTAARLVWLLRATGHDASLLDGGLDAWPGPFESGAPERQPAPASTAPFRLDRWPPGRLASADEAASAAVLLDARAPERYRGAVEPVDSRPGHIPGARNAPTSANLDDQGRFKPAQELRALYEGLGVEAGTAPVVYCGSGVTACHDLIALELAGVAAARLYPGSWSQWSADPSRAVETGA